MDITLSDEQDLVYRTALQFAQDAMPREKLRDAEVAEPGFDPAVWRQMAALGWTAMPFRPEYGGGFSLLDLGLVIEACARAALPAPFFSTVVEAGLLIDECGSPALRDAWLPRIAAGTALLTTAVLEPNAGLGPRDIQASITVTTTGYRLSGTKLFVRHAAAAEAIAVVGRSDPDANHLTWLLVPRDLPGVVVERMPASGAEPLYAVTFDDVELGIPALVGEINDGWAPLRRLLLRGAALKAMELVGIGQAALDLTVAYAQSRVQFGRPIGTFQAVHHHAADMYRDLQSARLLAWQAAARLARPDDPTREVAMAKAKASEVVPGIARTAHQIHGGVGYYTDYPLGVYYNNATAAQAAYGNAAHHRAELAELLRQSPQYLRPDLGHMR
ncbi:MAG: acyl-CoA dehydrogenase family protein [Dehalococcoidia bacterium]